MGGLLADLRRVVETEIEGVQERASNTGFRVALLAAAGIIVLLGLLALEASAYLALATVVSRPIAALLTAVGTFVLAGIIAVIANASTGKAKQLEIQLRKDVARQQLQRDVARVTSLATMTTGVLASLKKLRPAASPPPVIVAPAPPGTLLLPPPAPKPPAIWRGNQRNGIIAAVAALGFAVGVSPALRRSMKKLIS